MRNYNPPKAVILLVLVVGLLVLMGFGRIDTETGMPVITLVVGYATGNGINAARGKPSPPVIGPQPITDPPVNDPV